MPAIAVTSGGKTAVGIFPMPNRILREGILTSERVNALPSEAEIFYRRLMSVVDDFGRYPAHPALLRAALYPLQLDRVREANMERLLAACEKVRLVRLYVVAGKRYLELLDFGQHVRAKHSKCPAPDGMSNADAVHQDSISTTDAPGDGDGDGDDYSSSTDVDAGEVVGEEDPPEDPPFVQFWRAYPRRVGKVPAEKAFAKHGCAKLMETILPAIERQKETEDWIRNGGQFIPHPATWINRHGWEDELRPMVAATFGNPTPNAPEGYRMVRGQWQKKDAVLGWRNCRPPEPVKAAA